VGVAVAGAALVLSGCQTQSPIQTDEVYMPADGVGVVLGPVQVRDLVVVSGGKDKPGTLSGAVSNSSGESQRIGFALPDGQPVFAEVGPHAQQRLSGTTQVQLPSVPAEAGSMVNLTVQTQSAPAVVTMVPVVAPNLYYQTVSPTTAASTTTTSPATGATTGTAGATSSPSTTVR
jgi:hypothetical protein